MTQAINNLRESLGLKPPEAGTAQSAWSGELQPEGARVRERSA
ncbi:MAG TPA: hypothetical protein VMH37_04325 [Candidatus Binataceae bacterium]|nr:hypothetical protein [Candidatus Binataceae bacterium]